MREILFRGKQKYNNEWIYGSLVRLGKESFSDPDRYGITDKGIPIVNMDVCYNLKVDEVIPETVGQYTGMSDNNGKPIFEGDILKLGTGKTRFVFYGISSFRHTIYNGYAKEFDFKDRGYQVIGNIFDNTELLRGETE